jgi:hypothetical protein
MSGKVVGGKNVSGKITRVNATSGKITSETVSLQLG